MPFDKIAEVMKNKSEKKISIKSVLLIKKR